MEKPHTKVTTPRSKSLAKKPAVGSAEWYEEVESKCFLTDTEKMQKLLELTQNEK